MMSQASTNSLAVGDLCRQASTCSTKLLTDFSSGFGYRPEHG